MPTHVALLRGVNVGGNNRVPMAELRRIAADIGLEDPATYVQSGNLVFTTKKPSGEVAAALAGAIASELGVSCDVVVLTRRQFAAAMAANPFPVDDPKKVHLVFRSEKLTRDEVARIEAAQAQSSERGSPDRAEVVGSTVYLHTPDGLGRSDLAARLGRLKGSGTARNWTSVTKLMEMLDS